MRTKTVVVSFMLMAALAASASGQQGARFKPDPALTPGATLETTREDLCKSEYESPAREIPIQLKRQTFDRYGVNPNSLGYNVDHLIPTSLGGSNSPKNLWPQPLSGEWTYQMKNRLESRLHKMVCREAFSLERAQSEIATDWVTAYKKYVLKKDPANTSRDNQPLPKRQH